VVRTYWYYVLTGRWYVTSLKKGVKYKKHRLNYTIMKKGVELSAEHMILLGEIERVAHHF